MKEYNVEEVNYLFKSYFSYHFHVRVLPAVKTDFSDVVLDRISELLRVAGQDWEAESVRKEFFSENAFQGATIFQPIQYQDHWVLLYAKRGMSDSFYYLPLNDSMKNDSELKGKILGDKGKEVIYNQKTEGRLLREIPSGILMLEMAKAIAENKHLEQLVFDFDIAQREQADLLLQYFPAVFKKRVEEYPDNIAIQTSEKILTYRELAKHVMALADHLSDRLSSDNIAWASALSPHEISVGTSSLTQDDRLSDVKKVAIVSYRSAEAIISILACLSLGIPYVPIEVPETEAALKNVSDAERHKTIQILQETDVDFLIGTKPVIDYLCQEDKLKNLKLFQSNTAAPAENRASPLNLQEKRSAGGAAENNTNSDRLLVSSDITKLHDEKQPSDLNTFEIHLSPETLAYIIYSSGSTGKPKGIAVPQYQLIYNMQLVNRTLEKAAPISGDKNVQSRYVKPGSHVGQYVRIGFDAFLFDVMLALGYGATLYVYPESDRNDYGENAGLSNWVQRHQITHMVFPAEVLKSIPANQRKAFSGIQVLLAMGGLFTEAHIKWLDVVKVIINGYGPTESTISTTATCVNKDSAYQSDEIVYPIGPARDGVGVCILDSKEEVDSSLSEIIGYKESLYDQALPYATGKKVQGELYIIGDYLPYYWRNESLNQKKFQRFKDCPTVVYRTSDAGLFHQGGLICIARIGDDIKIDDQRFTYSGIDDFYRGKLFPALKDGSPNHSDDSKKHDESKQDPIKMTLFKESLPQGIYFEKVYTTCLKPKHLDLIKKLNNKINFQEGRNEFICVNVVLGGPERDSILNYDSASRLLVSRLHEKILQGVTESEYYRIPSCWQFPTEVPYTVKKGEGNKEEERIRRHFDYDISNVGSKKMLQIKHQTNDGIRLIDVPQILRPSFALQGIQSNHVIAQNLIKLWSELLAIDEGSISIFDKFTELGGNSLLTTALLNRVHSQYQVSIDRSTFYQNPSINYLTRYIKGCGQDKDTTYPRVKVEILSDQPEGGKPDLAPPIILIHALTGDASNDYQKLVEKLQKKEKGIRCVISIGLSNPTEVSLDDVKPIDNFIEMASHYRRCLTTSFQSVMEWKGETPDLKMQTQVLDVLTKQLIAGQYYILGWSAGGLIAYEMVRQIRMSDQHPPLILLDTLHTDIYHDMPINLTHDKDKKSFFDRVKTLFENEKFYSQFQSQFEGEKKDFFVEFFQDFANYLRDEYRYPELLSHRQFTLLCFERLINRFKSKLNFGDKKASKSFYEKYSEFVKLPSACFWQKHDQLSEARDEEQGTELHVSSNVNQITSVNLKDILILENIRAMILAVSDYNVSEKLPHITLIYCEESHELQLSPDLRLGWSNWIHEDAMKGVPGDHFAVLKEEGSIAIADAMSKIFEENDKKLKEQSIKTSLILNFEDYLNLAQHEKSRSHQKAIKETLESYLLYNVNKLNKTESDNDKLQYARSLLLLCFLDIELFYNGDEPPLFDVNILIRRLERINDTLNRTQLNLSVDSASSTQSIPQNQTNDFTDHEKALFIDSFITVIKIEIHDLKEELNQIANLKEPYQGSKKNRLIALF